MELLKRALMVQGCTSDAGKSYLTAGLCRLYANRGLRVAPFKAQNMSNNAGVTPAGLEMGRAQLLQARAARIPPDVRMNPVLVKPEGDTKSQVVVLGKPDFEVSQLPWTERKAHLWERVRASLHSLSSEVDLLLIEGAGSPAEVNLRSGDIVNMRVAEEVGASVLLVADIDRGGAFAHLLGTWHCLERGERARLLGFVLNKFRGDPTLLGDGTDWLEARTGVPTLGVVPHLKLPLPDEDAFSLPPSEPTRDTKPAVALLRLPHLSNFDEFDPLVHEEGVAVRWVTQPNELTGAAALVLPGSKSVAADLAWLRDTGLAAAVSQFAKRGGPVLGICGGLQLLGRELRDPHGIESGGTVAGLGLLDIETELEPQKTTRLTQTVVLATGERVRGYEIHHGRTVAGPAAAPYLEGGLGYRQGNVTGVYLHGMFENTGFRKEFLEALGVGSHGLEWSSHVDAALDRLAAHLETHLDMQAIDAALFGAPRRKRAARRAPALILITGGARSGKSRYAEALARHYGKDDVLYLATLGAGDDEMARRVARHRARRPESWQTVETFEAPRAVAEAIREADTATNASVILLDCLSGWVSNVLLEHEAEGEEAAVAEVLRATKDLLDVIRRTRKTVIIVTNEVGDGVVPAYPLGRWYRDALGLVNQRIAEAAAVVSLVTVGIPTTLKGTPPEVVLDPEET